MHPMAPRWIGLSLALWSERSSAAPFPFQILAEGSATEEETGPSPPATTRGSSFPDYQTTPPGGQTSGETTALEHFAEFIHGNLVYISAGASVVLFALLVACIAVILKRSLRVNAYYPCSFPSKMYVEQRDKAGGVQRFDQVPQKASRGQQSDAVDSGQRLQQDIMRAAKGLRTPNKHSPQGGGAPDVNLGPDTTDSGVLVAEEPATLTEEDGTSQPSEKEASDGETREGGTSPGQAGQEAVSADPPRPGADPSAVQSDHRPASQHSQCDSATLQLITGEKTAF